ncbi:MAG: HAD family hydrolase, partial [Acidobacteriota bacterium]
MTFDPKQLSAVFFDLDDTLVDTAGQLIEPALRDAAGRMLEAGMVAEFDPLLEFLKEQASAGRGGNYFAGAAEHFRVTDSDRQAIVEAGRRAYFSRNVPDLRPLPGILRLLEKLRQRHYLFLVTAGDPATQRAKVDRLALQNAFDAIRWVDSVAGEEKLPVFREILERFHLEAGRCVCVGDRVISEIRDANQLGMWTVRIRRGEFAAMDPANPLETPDFTVTDTKELAALFDRRRREGLP